MSIRWKSIVADRTENPSLWTHDGYFYDEDGEYFIREGKRWDVVTKFCDETFILIRSQKIFKTSIDYAMLEPCDDHIKLLALSTPEKNWRAALLRFRALAEREVKRREKKERWRQRRARASSNKV